MIYISGTSYISANVVVAAIYNDYCTNVRQVILILDRRKYKLKYFVTMHKSSVMQGYVKCNVNIFPYF